MFTFEPFKTLPIQLRVINPDPLIGHEFGKEWMIYDVGGSRTMVSSASVSILYRT